jgi:hypothetical protein
LRTTSSNSIRSCSLLCFGEALPFAYKAFHEVLGGQRDLALRWRGATPAFATWAERMESPPAGALREGCEPMTMEASPIATKSSNRADD